MAKKRKKHAAATKARVAVEALRERKTVAQIASQYLFYRAKATNDDQEVTALYEQIGRLQVELAWLKKMATFLSVDERRRLVAPDASLSIVRQCELLDISRAGIYYEPKGETALNLELMRKIDEQYTKTPFYGSRKITQRGPVVSKEGKLRREPQARATPDATDGYRSHLSKAQDQYPG